MKSMKQLSIIQKALHSILQITTNNNGRKTAFQINVSNSFGFFKFRSGLITKGT